MPLLPKCMVTCTCAGEARLRHCINAECIEVALPWQIHGGPRDMQAAGSLARSHHPGSWQQPIMSEDRKQKRQNKMRVSWQGEWNLKTPKLFKAPTAAGPCHWTRWPIQYGHAHSQGNQVHAEGTGQENTPMYSFRCCHVELMSAPARCYVWCTARGGRSHAFLQSHAYLLHY